MNSSTVFATDRTGRRRVLGPGDVLADGESLRVGVLAMDSAPPEPNPQALRDAAYSAMCTRLQNGGETPQTPAPTQQAAYDRMCAELDFRSRGAA